MSVNYLGTKHYFDSRVHVARAKMLEKTSELPVGGRLAVALPTAIASWSMLFANYTAVRVVDIVAKPILKSTNVLKTLDENGEVVNFSHGSKVKSWIILLPKLALSTIGIGINAATVAAIAPFYLIGKTIAIMAGHGRSALGKIVDKVDDQ
ncbi:MAG: hypothetical protein ACK5MA_03165 [Parachlamydiaceae bacterium]